MKHKRKIILSIVVVLCILLILYIESSESFLSFLKYKKITDWHVTDKIRMLTTSQQEDGSYCLEFLVSNHSRREFITWFGDTLLTIKYSCGYDSVGNDCRLAYNKKYVRREGKRLIPLLPGRTQVVVESLGSIDTMDVLISEQQGMLTMEQN